jgi:hypothetical protein
MRTRTCLLIQWMLLASISVVETGCGGSEIVNFAGSDGGPDGSMGTGGGATGGGGGTAGSSGAAAAAGGGTSGTGGTATGGTGGAAGKGGASGTGGAAGKGGASGTGGAAGKGGASGTGGSAGSSGASGSGGASGGSGGAAGSSGATTGAGGASGSSGASGAAGNAGNAGSAGSRIDAGRDGDASTADAPSDGDGATDRAGDAGCPDVFGIYDINNADGDCGDLNEDAPQEIRGTTQACFLHFISVVDGAAPAVNGGATLGPNGTFSGATLTLGTTARSPCRGSWDANQQELTVVCGTGSDECSVELRWEGP